MLINKIHQECVSKYSHQGPVLLRVYLKLQSYIESVWRETWCTPVTCCTWGWLLRYSKPKRSSHICNIILSLSLRSNQAYMHGQSCSAVRYDTLDSLKIQKIPHISATSPTYWCRLWKCPGLSIKFQYHAVCNYLSQCTVILSHCGIMTPYGNIDLGQHWLG